MWDGVTREAIVIKNKPYRLKQPKLYKKIYKKKPRKFTFRKK